MSAITNLLVQTGERVRQAVVADGYNNLVPTDEGESRVTYPCRLERLASAAASSPRDLELLEGRDTRQSEFLLYLEGDADITATDTWVQDGDEYEVVGEPVRPIGLANEVDHIECRLRLTQG